MYSDAMYSDAMYSDAMYSDAMYSDAMYSDAMYSDAMYSDAMHIFGHVCHTNVYFSSFWEHSMTVFNLLFSGFFAHHF